MSGRSLLVACLAVLTLLPAVLTAPSALAQENRRAAAFGIEVRQGRKPMPGVEVRLESEGPVRGAAPASQVTDADGRAEFWWLTPGIWRVDLLVDGEVAYFLTVRLDPRRRAEEMGSPARDVDAPNLRWRFFRPEGPPPEPPAPPPPPQRAEEAVEAPSEPAVTEPMEEDAEQPMEPPTAAPTVEPPPRPEPVAPPVEEPVEAEPTDEPTVEPTDEPLDEPTPPPTDQPMDEPSQQPVPEPATTEPASTEPPAMPEPAPEESAAEEAADPEPAPMIPDQTPPPTDDPVDEEPERALEPDAEAESSERPEPPARATPPPMIPDPSPSPTDDPEDEEPEMAADEPAQQPDPQPTPQATPPATPEPPPVAEVDSREPEMPRPREPEVERPDQPADELPEPAAPEAPPVPRPEPVTPEPATPDAPADPSITPDPAVVPEAEPEPAPVEAAPASAPRFAAVSGAAGDCPECKASESALRLERVVPPGDSGGGPSCGAGMAEAALRAARGLASRGQGLGPGMPLAGGDVARFSGGDSSCQLMGVVLPPGVRYRGYTYAVAGGGDSGGPCYLPRPCPVAGAVWTAPPVIQELDGGARMVYGVFRNTAAVPLRAEMTVFYTAD